MQVRRGLGTTPPWNVAQDAPRAASPYPSLHPFPASRTASRRARVVTLWLRTAAAEYGEPMPTRMSAGISQPVLSTAERTPPRLFDFSLNWKRRRPDDALPECRPLSGAKRAARPGRKGSWSSCYRRAVGSAASCVVREQPNLRLGCSSHYHRRRPPFGGLLFTHHSFGREPAYRPSPLTTFEYQSPPSPRTRRHFAFTRE